MLKIENLSFQYEGTENGLSDVNLTIKEGECVVLTGSSGSGKTTLIRLINGLAPEYYQGAYSGTILIEGKPSDSMPFWQKGKLIGSIFQEPQSQFFSSELEGEIAFACENYGMTRQEIIARTENAIATFELDALRNKKIDDFSSGEKQKTAIASAYAHSPQIYVCDEPTANLDEESAFKLSKVFQKLKQMGKTLVISEHRLAYLQGIADRYIYFKDGKILWDYTARQIEQMSERDRRLYGLRSIFMTEKHSLPRPGNCDRAMLTVEQLSFKAKKHLIFKDISFSAQRGQIIAITGHNGSGKTTLGTVLSGLKRQSAGAIKIQGKRVASGDRRKVIWYSANDTASQFFTNSVSEELLLNQKLSDEKIDKARQLLKTLRLYQCKDRHPARLSGGEKQRLAIACALFSEREIVILDEPTSGLDGFHSQIIGRVLQNAAQAGKIIFIISHDFELINSICQHNVALI